MKRIILVYAVTVSLLTAQKNIYEKNCIPCHQDLPTSLGEMFKRYLLVYSSEKYVKMGIKHYLKNPARSLSMMSDLFLDTYGVKKPMHFPEQELDEAIDIYWDRFKVFDKLK